MIAFVWSEFLENDELKEFVTKTKSKPSKVEISDVRPSTKNQISKWLGHHIFYVCCSAQFLS